MCGLRFGDSSYSSEYKASFLALELGKIEHFSCVLFYYAFRKLPIALFPVDMNDPLGKPA